GAVLELIAGTLHGLEHPGFFEEIEAMREQALADDETGKLLRLEHEHAPTPAVQERGRDRAGRTRADHDDVVASRVHHRRRTPAALSFAIAVRGLAGLPRNFRDNSSGKRMSMPHSRRTWSVTMRTLSSPSRKCDTPSAG